MPFLNTSPPRRGVPAGEAPMSFLNTSPPRRGVPAGEAPMPFLNTSPPRRGVPVGESPQGITYKICGRKKSRRRQYFLLHGRKWASKAVNFLPNKFLMVGSELELERSSYR